MTCAFCPFGMPHSYRFTITDSDFLAFDDTWEIKATPRGCAYTTTGLPHSGLWNLDVETLDNTEEWVLTGIIPGELGGTVIYHLPVDEFDCTCPNTLIEDCKVGGPFPAGGKQSFGTTAINVNPVGVNSGDLLIMIGWQLIGAYGSNAFSNPPGWILLAQVVSYDGTYAVSYWYKLAQGGLLDNVVFPPSQLNQSNVVNMYRFINAAVPPTVNVNFGIVPPLTTGGMSVSGLFVPDSLTWTTFFAVAFDTNINITGTCSDQIGPDLPVIFTPVPLDTEARGCTNFHTTSGLQTDNASVTATNPANDLEWVGVIVGVSNDCKNKSPKSVTLEPLDCSDCGFSSSSGSSISQSGSGPPVVTGCICCEDITPFHWLVDYEGGTGCYEILNGLWLADIVQAGYCVWEGGLVPDDSIEQQFSFIEVAILCDPIEDVTIVQVRLVNRFTDGDGDHCAELYYRITLDVDLIECCDPIVLPFYDGFGDKCCLGPDTGDFPDSIILDPDCFGSFSSESRSTKLVGPIPCCPENVLLPPILFLTVVPTPDVPPPYNCPFVFG